MLVMAALLAAAADLGGLSLAADSRQEELLVGEPLKLTLRWKAARPVAGVAVEEPRFLFQSVLLSVDDGTGARLYREYPREIVEKTLVARSLALGEEEVVNLVFARGAYLARPGGPVEDGFVFPRVGEYSVRVLYAPDGVPSGLASKRLRFAVRAPSESDVEILRALREDPRLATLDGSAGSQARAKAFLDLHPDSPYLRLAKLVRFEQQADDLQNERDPVTGESVFALGREGLADLRRRHFRRMAAEIFADGGWGPFEEEALALAALYALAGGDEETRVRARQELFAKYPLSATVKRIKEEEAAPDDTEDDPPAAVPPKTKQ